MDEDFNLMFSQPTNITQNVGNSFMVLISNGGVGVVLFNEEFFKDGRKYCYNPSDELIYLNFLHRIQKVKMIPVWVKIKVEEVKVPKEFERDYEESENVPGVNFSN